jgi:hypothetical protein
LRTRKATIIFECSSAFRWWCETAGRSKRLNSGRQRAADLVLADGGYESGDATRNCKGMPEMPGHSLQTLRHLISWTLKKAQAFRVLPIVYR